MIRLDAVVLRGALVLALLPACAGAMDISVTRTDDPAPNGCQPGDCSLREAVILANALGGPDRIALPAGAYELTIGGSAPGDATAGDLDLGGDVEIDGAGAATTTITAANTNRLFAASAYSFVLKKLTLTGGRADTGGAIVTGGPLTIEDAVLSNNQVTGSGGAISGGASEIILRRTQLSNNTAGSAGGAVYAGVGGVLVVDSTISQNTATSFDGGGIYSDGATRIYRSLIANNHAGYGGGISCETDGSVEIHESTFSGNGADVGGGIYSKYPLLVDRSTFSANTATTSGGAVAVSNSSGSGNFEVSSTTLFLNTAASGSAMYFFDVYPSNPPILVNTVISGTCATSGANGFTALFGNVESPGNSCGLPSDQGHDTAAVDLKLGALADNGGPTPTHLPLAGSAVLAAGQNCPSYDQRGYGLLGTAVCDSGSVSAGAVDDAVFRYDFDF